MSRDQDVARFEIGLCHVQDDSGPPFDGPGRIRQADQRTGGQIVASVRSGDGLAIDVSTRGGVSA